MFFHICYLDYTLWDSWFLCIIKSKVIQKCYLLIYPNIVFNVRCHMCPFSKRIKVKYASVRFDILKLFKLLVTWPFFPKIRKVCRNCGFNIQSKPSIVTDQPDEVKPNTFSYPWLNKRGQKLFEKNQYFDTIMHGIEIPYK